jgi:prephenate dehydrogenase
MNIAIVGVGLIGGSMALALKESGFAQKIIGVESNRAHAQKAIELGLADEVASLEDAVLNSDVVMLAIPVDALENVLPQVLGMVDHQIILEAGSTKSRIIELVKDHPKRKNFVATHPMWGTEYSGPEAAVRGAFSGKAVVICNKEESSTEALAFAERFYTMLGMHIVYMNAVDHDVHTAYISHVSHITSFALANTVLEKEREENAIFELASAGFESTVRLAKSNAAMWVPIFMQNRENVLDVLNEHISQLRKFKACLEKENYEYLNELIQNANKIRRIIK